MITSTIWIQYTNVADRQTDSHWTSLDDSKDRANGGKNNVNYVNFYTCTIYGIIPKRIRLNK